MFVRAAQLYDPQVERRDDAARERTVLALTRARRLRRWADRSARLAAALDRHARAHRTLAA